MELVIKVWTPIFRYLFQFKEVSMSTWFRIEEDFSSFFDYFHTTLKNHKTNFSNGISVNWLLCHFLCSNTFWTLYIIQKKTLLLYWTFFNHLNIYIKMWHHPSSISFLHLSKRKPLNSFIDIRQLLVLTFELNRLVTR